MRKIIILICSAFIIEACGADYYDSIVTNNSGGSVSYVYDGHADTLPNGASKVYSITLAVMPPSVDFSQFSHPISVMIEHRVFYYEFVSVAPLSLWIINDYGEDITLSSEYLNENNLIISKDTNADTGKKIYIDKPAFTITPDTFTHTPFVKSFSIENSTMTVTIQ
jgi:hypothetical protein